MKWQYSAMRNLIVTYGEERISRGGCDVLEYPGTWATHKHEIRLIQGHIERGRSEQKAGSSEQ